MSMKKTFLFLTAGLFLFGCKEAKKEAATSPYQALADQYEEFTLTTDISKLTDKEKQMIPILIQAADIMDDIYWQEAFGDKTPLFQRFANDSAALKYLSINYGPWDRLDDNKPFIEGYGAKPLGANFYPQDMTKEEFDAFQAPDKDNAYSVIRRDAEGKLQVIPYHEAFPEQIEKAASLLEQAAALAEDEGLRNYLTLRAKALRTDDYLESDLAWMDMKDNTLDFVVGPIETYEDLLFGYRASSSGQILVKDKEWSKRLSEYARHLPRLQEELPVPAAYKQEKANANADLNAYDVIYYAGDCNAGSKNIAINLPNDPRVHAAKGSRKLQLKNVMDAKFQSMVVPISKVVINPEQLKHVKGDAFFENTMFHEIAHGLGVKYTIKDKQEVRNALQSMYSIVEEAKADILGLYCITKFAEWGVLQNKDLMDNYVTFVAGIFRSVRFGAASAHGNANMMQFNHLMQSGAITRDASTGYYTVDFEKMKADIADIAEEYITMQGDGDLKAATDYVNANGTIPAVLQQDLDRIANAGIPKDIYFRQGAAVLGL